MMMPDTLHEIHLAVEASRLRFNVWEVNEEWEEFEVHRVRNGDAEDVMVAIARYIRRARGHVATTTAADGVVPVARSLCVEVCYVA